MKEIRIRSLVRPNTTIHDPNYTRNGFIHLRYSNRPYRENLIREAESNADGRGRLTLSGYIFELIDEARAARGLR